MAEATLSVQHLPRSEAWSLLDEQLRAILDGVDDEVTAMATTACLVHHGFGWLWTGFYRVVSPGLLRVGPYQGTLGCLEIPFGKGVCGAAAASQRSVLVPNVHAFPGHITCDGRSASELVVPVFRGNGALLAVFDIDADVVGAFSEVDQVGVERVLTVFGRF